MGGPYQKQMITAQYYSPNGTHYQYSIDSPSPSRLLEHLPTSYQSRLIALHPPALYVTLLLTITMIRLRYILQNLGGISVGELIPLFGMITGIIIPLAVFFWQYLEGKERRETILEISKTIDDPDRLDELLKMLDERKEEPTDYRRGGVITTFVGLGILPSAFMLSATSLKALGHGRTYWSWHCGCWISLPTHRPRD